MLRLNGRRATRGFLPTIRADLESMAELKKAPLPSVRGYVDVLTLPGTWAVLLFRAASALHRLGIRPVSRLVYFANVVLFSCDIPPGTEIGGGLALPHPVGVTIAPDARVGRRARVFSGALIGGGAVEDESEDGFPTIGDDCWIFAYARVFGRINVGDRAVVSTSSLVVRDVPRNTVVAGVPARVVRHRDDRSVIGEAGGTRAAGGEG
jgi:serine O-acetyltransferase